MGVGTGTTYQWCYRGKTTNALYRFAPVAIPAALLDANGNLLEYGTFNGETIVQCSQAGEVRRSTKGNPDAKDPYAAGLNPSPWESSV